MDTKTYMEAVWNLNRAINILEDQKQAFSKILVGDAGDDEYLTILKDVASYSQFQASELHQNVTKCSDDEAIGFVDAVIRQAGRCPLCGRVVTESQALNSAGVCVDNVACQQHLLYKRVQQNK